MTHQKILRRYASCFIPALLIAGLLIVGTLRMLSISYDQYINASLARNKALASVLASFTGNILDEQERHACDLLG